ncbi:MAG: Short-chain dehydrogenase/reductase [Streptosporangiaceae bacterium]|nr:Short-chain dehydrogenase/reductase [Streptosporangiaceae bacterium]
MNTTSGLAGRRVIVTGAGSGIGRAAAVQFADQGTEVLVVDVNADGAAQAVQDIRATGAVAHAVVGDLSEQKTVDEVVATALAELGGVDVLVNNAGIMDDMSAAADVADAVWERVLRVNLTAPFLLTRAVLPHLLVAGRGSIVFTASEASLRGSAAGTAYTVSKDGIAGLTKSLAVMYRDQGIRVNAIAPGATMTNIELTMTEGALGPTVLGSYTRNFGKPATAAEQAAAIVFLASDAASNINGAILPVDNGWAAV